jgi:hypothetical protein
MENINTRKGLINDDTKVNIEREVSELIKKGADKASMKDLRRKFGDDNMFSKIHEAYFEKLTSIQKRSIKFTKLIEKKYGMLGYPLHIILNKALKYKKKYNLSDEEFELFRQYYQKSMNMRNNPNKFNVLVPNTNMAKVFGDDPYTNNKIHTSDKDHILIKEIIDLYEGSRFLWQQITLQSIMYQSDLPITKFDVNLNNTKMVNFSSPIHPVVAALFLPKINNFDEYFLFTNLAYILKCKHLGEQLTTYHSYLMLYNLVTDPTDVVCNSDSPLRDILNRGVLQITLWRNVLKLREGSVYDTNNSFVASDFMINIDGCKLSTYDAPDLLMIGDENVIIRRLLNALSFRCATVMTTPTIIPLLNANINNTMQVNTLNIPFNLTQITKVPMIYIRLPPKIINSVPTNLQTVQNSLNTIQTVMSNGKLESRSLTVANTEHLLIISIPRRTYKPIGTGIYNLPQVFNFSSMPHHAIGLEVLNDTPVATNKCLIIPNLANTADNKRFSDKLFLKSAVVLKERKDNQHHKFIYGTKTYMINYHCQEKEIRVYNPISDIQKIDIATNQITMIPLRYLTSVFCNQIVRNADNNLPSSANFKEKYVTSLEEEDKIHDFLQRQTILIYTNELKHNCDIKDFKAGTDNLPDLSSTSSQTDCTQYHYNDIVKSLNINNSQLTTLKKSYLISLVIPHIMTVFASLIKDYTEYYNSTIDENTFKDRIDDNLNNYMSKLSLSNNIKELLKKIIKEYLIYYINEAKDSGEDEEIGTRDIITKIQNIKNDYDLTMTSIFAITNFNEVDYNNINNIDFDGIFKQYQDHSVKDKYVYYSNFNKLNKTGEYVPLSLESGVPLKEGNEGNQQLNIIDQFTVSKYVGDFPFINDNTTYKIEDQTNQEKVAAGTDAKNAIGILKTDIGLVPAHF